MLYLLSALLTFSGVPCANAIHRLKMRRWDTSETSKFGPFGVLPSRDDHAASMWSRPAEERSPWRAVPQGPDGGRNICVDGKQVPDFYLLGVQKCATGSLANNLMRAGMNNVHGNKNPKEFQWFDHRMNVSLVGVEGFEVTKQSWLKWMPECTEAKQGAVQRSVLADFTQDYFRIVPRPQEFNLTGKWLNSQERDVEAPNYMKQLYGNKAQQLVFAVMFREPLAQMQSAWYYAASFNFTNVCKSCRAQSFRAGLETVVAGLRKNPPELTPWAWTPMYARQLAPWLEHFNASQFYMIPIKQLWGDKKDNICRDLSRRLAFKAHCDSAGVESLHSWSHAHPGVDADAGPELRKLFDEVMFKEKKELVRVLAKSNAEGMGLANYVGEPGNVTGVQAWLESSW